MGLFHPEEAWDIFENHKNRISEDGEFLIIGEMFDSNDCYFCYRSSQPGIWTLDTDEYVFRVADRLHEYVEGWYPKTRSYWSEMDTVTQWNFSESHLQHHHIHYQWNVKPLLDYIQRCAELELNKSTFLAARKQSITVSLENTFARRSKNRMASIKLSSNLRSLELSYYEFNKMALEPETYDPIVTLIISWHQVLRGRKEPEN